MAKTNFQENAVLNTARGTELAAWAPFAALLTAATGDGSSVTEISYTNYARQSVTFGAPSDVGGNQTITNSAAITFPTSGGGTGGTATHVGIYDASTGGNLRYVLPMSPTVAVTNGVQPVINTGQLSIGEG